MLRLLTPDQKRDRKDVPAQCLAEFNQNPQDFLRRFVTVNESWIHHYAPESKEQSKEWVLLSKSVPKNAKTVSWEGDRHSILRFPTNNPYWLLGEW